MKPLLPLLPHSLASALLRCRALRAALVLPFAVTFLSIAVRAQTSVVPGLISYQGRVSDASGAFVGASTPVNRVVTFRIWSHPSNSASSDLVYSEQQTVTISQGEFSVLIGQGTAVNGETSKGPPNLTMGSLGVFSGAVRYLGVTVDDGTSAADTEISPRQQMVSAAYSFRAKYAEFLGANGVSTLTALDNGNIGIGTASPSSTLDVRGGTPVITVGTTDGTKGALYFGNSGHGLKRVYSGDNDLGLFTTGGNIYLSAAGSTSTGQFVLNQSGSVGIGTSSPGAKLEVIGGVRANGGSGFTFESETDGGLYSPADGTITIKTNGTERLRVDSSGNLGIGTSSPGQKLDIVGQVRITSDSGSGLNITGSGNNLNPAEITFNKSAATTTSPTGFNSAVGVAPDRGMFFWVDGSDRMNITKTGNVGIGTTSPQNKLHISSSGDAEFGVQSSDSSGRRWTFQSSGRNGDGSAGNVGKFQFVDRTAGASRLTIDTAGNVGIGTTTPGQKLHVEGKTYLKDEVGIGTSTPAAKLHVYGSGAVAIGLQSSDADSHVWTLAGGAGAAGYFQINDITAGAGRFGIDGSGNTFLGGLYLLPNQLNGTADTNAVTLDIPGDKTLGVWDNLVVSGNVGIGTSSPSQKLHVEGKSYLNGNVGIGVASPSKGQLEISAGPSFTKSTYGFLNSSGSAGGTSSNSTAFNYSIWAQGAIACRELQAYTSANLSDARIKVVKGRSDSHSDLVTLLGIEITDYRYKDVVNRGDGSHKKVIAQQVERVFPQAVSRRTDIVPDIYRTATINAGWVELDTDLKKGDRVRLITDAESSDLEVAEVEPGRFRTTIVPQGNKVFVFGREVNDCRLVDYEAIAMLNVSATQEIKREKDAEVAALREQNAALTTQVAELTKRLAEVSQSVATFEAKDRARDAQLASIEKLLLASQTVMARPAAAPRANGNGQE